MPGDAGARQFYGGEPLTGNPAPSAGEITAGRYTGPETHAQGPWKCPSCGAGNDGPIPQGCTACGAGKPGYHIGNPPPAEVDLALPPLAERANPPQEDPNSDKLIYDLAEAWSKDREDFGIIEAFVAGFKAARAQLQAQVMRAAPVTADVETLAPEGKPRRTIIAALEIFKDQILSQAPDEIASGEWCSPSEVDALIAQLRSEG